MSRPRWVVVLAMAAALALVALPALAAAPPDHATKAAKAAKTPISVSGTVERTEDAEGGVTFTLTDGGTTYELDAGPAWFFDEHPLDAYVGDTVTIDGQIAEGSTEIDVDVVDGTALRPEGGKPPWAGGWKAVGSKHPAWSQEKADRLQAKFGDCFPPGQCKEKPAKGGPEESAAP